MIRVSAYPTVEWLKSRACDREAIQSLQLRRNPASFASRLAMRLQEVVSDAVTIEERVWITTPDGESEVQIVIKNGLRRIAVQISSAYCHQEEASDAVSLVYGRFEALHRIDGDATNEALHESVYALMCDRPTWFSNFGRLSAGRMATNEIVLTANSHHEHHEEWISTARVRISRMRLCKANDWVRAFELALDARQRFPAA
ncbi:hypothetical protein HQ496_12100 [bacterium]|nr:hypothetical protein [bacterium]